MAGASIRNEHDGVATGELHGREDAASRSRKHGRAGTSSATAALGRAEPGTRGHGSRARASRGSSAGSAAVVGASSLRKAELEDWASGLGRAQRTPRRGSRRVEKDAEQGATARRAGEDELGRDHGKGARLGELE
jgi:hypothetical protein